MDRTLGSGVCQYPLLPDDSEESISRLLEGKSSDACASAQEPLNADKASYSNAFSRIRALLQSERTNETDNERSGLEEDSREAGEEAEGVVAYLPVPASSLVETMARELRWHPASVFRVLGEVVSNCFASSPVCARIVRDYVAALVLKTIGHKWPGDCRS